MKELYLGEEGKLKVLEGINKLSKAVLSTMGPMGKTVILQDEYGKPYVTKDGVSVSNAIRFMDPVENIGANLIKEVAQRTADEAGDGTTTSICLTAAFIQQGIKLIENDKLSVYEVSSEIDKLVEVTLEKLSKSKEELFKEDIHKVATISANGDKKIGQLIQQAYNYSDNVKVEEGKELFDKIEEVSGLVYDASYMSPKFINNEKRNECSLDDCKVLVLDKKLESLMPYEKIFKGCSENGIPLMIVTEFVGENTLKLLESNVINKNIKLGIFKSPGFGKYRKDHLSDIAYITGATVITNDKGMTPSLSHLGTAQNITIGKYKTTIRNDKDTSDKIKVLEEQLVNELVDYDKEVIKHRIDNLKGTLSIIKVGGSSEVEMKERKDRIDDAVLAVRSALEEGIVEGGGNALAKIVTSIDNKLRDVLFFPIKQIEKNSDGRIPVDLTKDYKLDNVIDPYKVTRCSLQNAASVAKIILSTEAIVINQMLWE